MTTLKETQHQPGKLKDFIAEREDTSPGDMSLFENTLTSMAKTKKVKRAASQKDSSED